MKKILISYADQNMAYSLKRLGNEARKLGLFDQVCLYTENDLPDYIKASPLMKYKRGGGYWVWKPAIIWETLQKYGDNVIVVYLDAGCSVNSSLEWQEYFELLNRYDTLCFEYNDFMPEWEKFGQTSTLIKYWTKESTIEFFKEYLKDNNYFDKYNKIWGGAVLVKGKSNVFIKNWLNITLQHPNLIIDPLDEELRLTGNKCLAFHKHDQSIITPLAHYFNDSVLVLRETAETNTDGPIVGSRIRVKTYFDYLKFIAKNRLRKYLGLNFYNYLKMKFKMK